MKLIVSATNRKGSYSLRAARAAQKIYRALREDFEILDLSALNWAGVLESPYSSGNPPAGLKPACGKILKAEALVIVCPEYNGSFPGAFKLFLDHWHYPGSFSFKPVCLIGLGGRFGALRPLEQLSALFLYRNSFLFPEKIFITEARDQFDGARLKDKDLALRLQKQAKNFLKFIRALKTEAFD